MLAGGFARVGLKANTPIAENAHELMSSDPFLRAILNPKVVEPSDAVASLPTRGICLNGCRRSLT